MRLRVILFALSLIGAVAQARLNISGVYIADIAPGETCDLQLQSAFDGCTITLTQGQRLRITQTYYDSLTLESIDGSGDRCDKFDFQMGGTFSPKMSKNGFSYHVSYDLRYHKHVSYTWKLRQTKDGLSYRKKSTRYETGNLAKMEVKKTRCELKLTDEKP